MVWAQAFLFVALQLFEGDEMTKDALALFLIGSFASWLLLNIAFFCTIDLSYLKTFFGTKTAPQYTVELYETATDDSLKWNAAFANRFSFTKKIHVQVRQWVADNVVRWQREKPDWFKIEMIPDDMLPREVLAAEGGANRTRTTTSTELVGSGDGAMENQQQQQRSR